MNRLKLKHVIIILCIVLATVYISMKGFWGNEKIGSFFSKFNYNTQYVVFVNDGKSLPTCYKLFADTEVRFGEIRISKAYWTDNKYIDFIPDKDHIGDILELNKNNLCRDIDGKEWYVFLTDFKTK